MKSPTNPLFLGAICSKIGSGATPRGGKNAYLTSGPYALIRSQNVLNRGFSKEGLAYISPEQAKALDGVAVEDGDVLLNITGDSVARVCQAPAWVLPARVNQHVAIIRPRPELLDSKFLRYFLVSPEQQLLLLTHASSGATRNALIKGMIEKFEIPAIPIGEQKSRVSVLAALDNRIEHNRALAANLEAIARRLFKSWFVDFDPIRAKAAGEKPPGLADDIAALFPDRFVESELGEIPEGWVFQPLSCIAEFVNGRNFTKDATGTGRMVIRIAELSNDRPTGSTVWNDLPDTAEQYLANPGEILFAWSGSLGLHVWDRDTGLVNQHIFKVIPKQPFVAPFVFFAIEELIDDFRAIAASKAVTMGHIKRGDLDTHGCLCPFTPELLVAFHEIVAPLWNRVRVARREVLALGAIRDLLLPRLISGKLSVEGAVSPIEEAFA
ncbi:restriction endonuclease subunit S [Ferrovum sp.]|uniref:restriction endonuclease subunit S n=1 Tax=Ferrovum sp. TaxID=2609467 RepID=UPI0026380582|nr:restriction endonuclease subunit S [Ferrovum sp.]